MKLLSIITPTFNREKYLERQYHSILAYPNLNEIEWIVIDDGSTDNTKELIANLIYENKLAIKYHYQENSGKSFAVNKGYLCCKSKFTLVIDSDDFFNKKELSSLQKSIKELEDEYEAIVFLRGDLSGKHLGDKFSTSKSTYLKLFYGKKQLLGDKPFVIRTEICKNTLIEPLNNEKFIPETVFYYHALKDKQLKTINLVIILGEYLETGLSSNFLLLFQSSPQSFIYCYNLINTCKDIPLKTRLKSIAYYTNIQILNKTKFKKTLIQTKNKGVVILFYPLLKLYHIFK